MTGIPRLDLLREFWNGVWFALILAMVITLIIFIIRRISIQKHWYQELGTRTAVALTVYLIGSGARAGYVWILHHCLNTGTACSILDVYWLLDVAGLIGIFGGICLIRVLSPPEWLPWSWFAAIGVAILVPFLHHDIINWLDLVLRLFGLE